MIKKDLKDYPKFLDWVLSTDKVDHKRFGNKTFLHLKEYFLT